MAGSIVKPVTLRSAGTGVTSVVVQARLLFSKISGVTEKKSVNTTT